MVLEKGKSYKIKYEDNKRAETLTYDGDYSDAKEPTAMFLTRGGYLKFYEYSKITVIADAQPKEAKKAGSKVCPRCLGNKVYEHFSHVNGGKCFKCNGTGRV